MLEPYAGHVLLLVNVASKCVFTSQYAALEKMFRTHKDQGLLILGVPCNQFGGQEPGKQEEILSFCQLNYGVTFPILEKQDVKGANQSPLYKFLIESKVGNGSSVKWNFEKFLVARDGRVVDRWRSFTTPANKGMIAAVERALAE